MYEHVCGVKPLWNDFLIEQGVEPNSILAGYTIYQHYLTKTSSQYKALKGFKGIISHKNFWIVNKVQRVLIEVKQIHLKD